MRLGKSQLSRHRAQVLEARASGMRRTPTPSEAALFELVRGNRLCIAFRRQVVLAGGRYIADLFAPSIGLVVEVDGACHARRHRADARRDRVLARLGLYVLRLDAALVMNQPDVAVARLREVIESLSRRYSATRPLNLALKIVHQR